MLEHSPHYLTKNQNSSDRSFGFVFAAVFLIIALFPVINAQGVKVWAIVVSGIFLLLATLTPRILAPANRLWMKFGKLLHRIVSPLALGIVFYVAVLPTGLLMRLLGKDILRLRLDQTVESYWIKRDPPGPSAKSLNNQF